MKGWGVLNLTGTNEPSLGRTGRAFDVDAVVDNPLNVQQKGEGLLDVGEEKVHDQYHELVVGMLGLLPPCREAIAEVCEERDRGEEREKAEEGYC